MSKTYDFKIKKELPDNIKPEEYSKALEIITSTAEAKDLITLAEKIKEKPGLIKTALQYI